MIRHRNHCIDGAEMAIGDFTEYGQQSIRNVTDEEFLSVFGAEHKMIADFADGCSLVNYFHVGILPYFAVYGNDEQI